MGGGGTVAQRPLWIHEYGSNNYTIALPNDVSTGTPLLPKSWVVPMNKLPYHGSAGTTVRRYCRISIRLVAVQLVNSGIHCCGGVLRAIDIQF